MQLIGIAGRAGAGKDTVADFLVAEYGYEKVSFAKILKAMLTVAGIKEPLNRDDKELPIGGLGFSYRYAAQTLGTEWGRVCLDEDIWVKLTMKLLSPNGKYVFSDVRFNNESFAIIQAGGAMIHLHGRQVDLGELSNHPSEKPLIASAHAHHIWNDESLEKLFVGVRGIAEALEWQAKNNA